MASAKAPGSVTDRDNILSFQEWLVDKDLAICQLEDHGGEADPRFLYTEVSNEYAEKLAKQYRAYRKGDNDRQR